MKRLAVLCAMLVAASAQAQEPPKRQMLSSQNGRFVMGQIGEYASSQYLIDTQTGRVWEVVNMTDGKGNTTGSALRQVKFVTADGTPWGVEPPPASK